VRNPRTQVPSGCRRVALPSAASARSCSIRDARPHPRDAGQRVRRLILHCSLPVGCVRPCHLRGPPARPRRQRRRTAESARPVRRWRRHSARRMNRSRKTAAAGSPRRCMVSPASATCSHRASSRLCTPSAKACAKRNAEMIEEGMDAEREGPTEWLSKFATKPDRKSRPRRTPSTSACPAGTSGGQ
jgi:hypothetical protein